MRSRLKWFCAGFAAGVVALYITLWQGGVLSPYLTKVRAQSRLDSTPALRDKASEPTLATAGLVAPIEGLKAKDIIDTYNQSRSGGHIHEATDIMEPRGTPVHAIVDGTIRKLFLSKAGGNTIYQFDDAQELCYYYAHLDRYAEGVREGQRVIRGTVIGYVGSTGDAAAAAPHLHLGITRLGPEKNWWGGVPINPYPLLIELAK